MTQPRIYADFNGLEPSPHKAARLLVPLDTVGSVRDLSNAGLRLRDGLQLTICDWSDEEEDLEAAATASYDHARRVWLAELGPEGYSYVPKGDRTPDSRFLCLGCRHDNGPAPNSAAALPLPPPTCPHCGLKGDSAIAPPAA